MPYISKIQLPGSNTPYIIKDDEARRMISAGVSFIIAWDGTSTPVVASIPEGVKVVYNGTTYTGKLAAEGEQGAQPGAFYLVKSSTSTSGSPLDVYDEYVPVGATGSKTWEKIGDTQVDLSDVVTDVSLSKQTTSAVTALGIPATANVIGASSTFSVTQPTITVTPSQTYLGATASGTAVGANGTAAVGTGTTWARADHVHPTDTSRAPLASPEFTGTPIAPTAAAGTNTTQIATTAFVKKAVEDALFVAEYGVTTYAEISAVLDADKPLFCYVNWNDIVCPYIGIVNNQYAFSSLGAGESTVSLYVNSSNQWSYATTNLATQSAVNAKQDALVSGTNIKTINNTSLLGSGNIDISSGGAVKGSFSFTGQGGDTVEGEAGILHLPDANDHTFSLGMSGYANEGDPDDEVAIESTLIFEPDPAQSSYGVTWDAGAPIMIRGNSGFYIGTKQPDNHVMTRYNLENETWMLTGGNHIPANSDLNNYTSTGSYYCTQGSTISNCPTNSDYFMLKVMKYGTTAQVYYITQELTPYGSTKKYIRYSQAPSSTPNWNDWKEFAILDDVWTLSGGTEIPSNADLNDYTTQGNYYSNLNTTARTVLNTPWGTAASNSAMAFILKVVKPTTGEGTNMYVRQELYPYKSTAKYVRYTAVDSPTTVSWQPWVQILTTDDQASRTQYLSNYYHDGTGGTRPTTANIPSDNRAGLRKFLATGSMTEGKPVSDGHIIHMDWDNSTRWAGQIWVNNSGTMMGIRGQTGASTEANGGWSDWVYMATQTWVTTQITNAIGDAISGSY